MFVKLISRALLTLAVLGLVACGSDSSDSDTVTIGQIADEGGPFVSPTTARLTLAALIREQNDRGGVGNPRRQIAIKTANPQGTLPATQQAAKTFADDDSVVAMVGSSATFSCLADNDIMADAGLYSIGNGQQGACFSTPNYGAVTQPPASIIALSTRFMDRRYGNSCLIGLNVPGGDAQYDRAEQIIDRMGLRWRSRQTIPVGDDPSPAIIRANTQGCRGIVFVGTLPMAKQAMDTIKRQRFDHMHLLGTVNYNVDFLRTLGSSAEGFLATAQMDVFTERTPTNGEYLALARRHNLPLNEYGQSAYISGWLALRALNSINGPITRETASAAIRGLDTNAPMLGNRFVFGDADAHAPNYSAKFVEVRNGRYRAVSDYQSIPENLTRLLVNFR